MNKRIMCKLILGDIMEQLIEVIPRGLISLIILFFMTKLLGKKQVSQLSLFDYVIGISIGNFAAEITINTDVPLMNGTIAVILFGIIAYIISKLTMKSISLRRFVTGSPTVLLENGKFIYKNMYKTNFDMNDFLEECRVNGYFDLNELEYAILEANGQISFMPKPEYKPLTPNDMKVKVKKQGLCANAIIDGNIMLNNINNFGKTKDWLDKELKLKGYKNYENILLATIDINEKITIYEKNKCIEVSNVLE